MQSCVSCEIGKERERKTAKCTRGAHEHCNHQFLLYANTSLNLFVPFKCEPDRFCSLYSGFLFYQYETGSNFFLNNFNNSGNIIWNNEERNIAIDRTNERRKKCSGESNFFSLVSFVHSFCLRMSSKNQIKFNKKGKHISHN